MKVSILNCKSLGSGTELRIQYRQYTQQDHITKIILNSSTVFLILSLTLCLSSSITRRLYHFTQKPATSSSTLEHLLISSSNDLKNCLLGFVFENAKHALKAPIGSRPFIFSIRDLSPCFTGKPQKNFISLWFPVSVYLNDFATTRRETN
jgi:hypothetical protein